MRKIIAPLLFLFSAIVVAAAVISHGLSFETVGLGLIGLAALDSLAGAFGLSTVMATTGGSFANLSDALKIRYDDPFLGRVSWS